MDGLYYVGQVNHRHLQREFGIRDKDRLGHIYALGKTGMGKTTLLLNLATQDIQTGNGLCVIDPHGDMIETLLARIPNYRLKDLILFNPKEICKLPSFNPLYQVPAEERYLVASNIVSVFKKIWSESWGPRLEHILRNTLHTLTYYPGATLLDIGPILTDQQYRYQILQHVNNPTLLRFWEKEYNTLTSQQRNDHISPILNKVGILSSHPVIRAIIGNSETSINFKEIMDGRKILLANLSKGILGEEGTTFLGSLLLTQFQNTALARANIPYSERVPFYLYVDEMHSFVTLSFADILSEARKYGLGLFLTHQFLDQLHEDIRKSILGNVGTIICFRLGARDAEIMEQEFYPIFTKEDLCSLPQFHIYLKLLIDGCVSEGFSAKVLPPERN